MRTSKIADYNLSLYTPELTTVFLSNYNNKTYLIEYERFWRFDESTWTMDEGYPKDMSAWRGIPNSVDAAIIWKGGNATTIDIQSHFDAKSVFLLVEWHILL